MKILEEPPRQEFGMYIARPETAFAEREEGDSLSSIYGTGYLPYSGAENLQNVFYSARSARVVLPRFQMTSENRRIAKKFDGQFTRVRVPAQNFIPDEAWYDFCLNYFAQKHGAHAMPRARLQTILKSGIVSTIITYTSGSQPVGYVLEVEEGGMAHYWYSFYDTALAKQSLGMWLMLDCVRSAKERGLQHYYLGTVYSEKALYKTNFEPLEWWDGATWNTDIKLLKERGRSDEIHTK